MTAFVVRPNDTLYALASRYFLSKRNYQDVRKVNQSKVRRWW